jgi:hypothetical protein
MPIEIIYTIYDKKNKRATTSVKLGESETLARVGLFAVAWADAIDNLIGGVIRSAVAMITANPNGLTGNNVGTNSDVEEIGAMQFNCETGPPIEVTIPAINEAKVLNDSGDLDTADTDVAALIAIFEEGLDVTGDTVFAVNTGNERSVDMVYARERSRNSGARRIR